MPLLSFFFFKDDDLRSRCSTIRDDSRYQNRLSFSYNVKTFFFQKKKGNFANFSSKFFFHPNLYSQKDKYSISLVPRKNKKCKEKNLFQNNNNPSLPSYVFSNRREITRRRILSLRQENGALPQHPPCWNRENPRISRIII